MELKIQERHKTRKLDDFEQYVQRKKSRNMICKTLQLNQERSSRRRNEKQMIDQNNQSKMKKEKRNQLTIPIKKALNEESIH